MSDSQTEINKLEKSTKLFPKVADWYSIMAKARERLIAILENLEEEALDFTPNKEKFESIGTLLMHIAAVEWSWIFEDIDGLEFDYERFKYGFALRPNVNIPQIKGKSKQFYLNELNDVRNQVYDRLLKLKDEELENIIASEGENYTIEWILFHIIEHEIMHIGQILFLRRMFRLHNPS